MNFRLGSASGNVTYNEANGGYPFSFTILQAANDVAPSNTRYVAKFGNDASGNGSRERPFATLGRALQDTPAVIVVGSGEYLEGNYVAANAQIALTIVADGPVTFNGASVFTRLLSFSSTTATGGGSSAAYASTVSVAGITFRAYTRYVFLNHGNTNRGFNAFKCTFANTATPFAMSSATITDLATLPAESASVSTLTTRAIRECVFTDITGYIHLSVLTTASDVTIANNSRVVSNNTFFNCPLIKVREQDAAVITDNSFTVCNIQIEGTFFSSYNHYFGCLFRRRPMGITSQAWTGTVLTDTSADLFTALYRTPANIRSSYSAWGQHITVWSTGATTTAGSPTMTVTANGAAAAAVVGWRLYGANGVYIGQVQSVTGTPAAGQTITLTANSLLSQTGGTFYYSVANEFAAQNPLPFNSATTPTTDPSFTMEEPAVANTATLIQGLQYLVVAGNVTYNAVAYLPGNLFSVPVGGTTSFTGDGLVSAVRSIRDFTLRFTSPLRAAAMLGNHIGAYRVARTPDPYTVRLGAVWQLNTAAGYAFTNLVADQLRPYSVTLNPSNTSNGTVLHPVQDFSVIRELRELHVIAEQATRDGEGVDTTRVIGTGAPVTSGGLVQNEHYLVENAPIVYDFGGLGVRTIMPGERFTALATTTFSGSGVCRQLVEAPNRVTYEARYSFVPFTATTPDTDTSLSSWSDALGTNWKRFTVNEVPRVDSSGRGNGDVLFSGNSTTVIARYVQIRITVRRDNPKG